MLKTNLSKTIAAVKEYLMEPLNRNDLVQLYRTYCMEYNFFDDIIEFMDDLDDLYHDVPVHKFLDDLCKQNRFDYSDNFFSFDGYGFLYSFNDPENIADVDELAEDIVKNREDYYICDNLSAVLDEMERGA